MASPAIVTLPSDTWIKVATAVTTGQVHKLTQRPTQVLHTYRATGEAAPSDLSEGIPMSKKSIPIRSLDPIDIYLYAQGEEMKVRVDV